MGKGFQFLFELHQARVQRPSFLSQQCICQTVFLLCLLPFYFTSSKIILFLKPPRSSAFFFCIVSISFKSNFLNSQIACRTSNMSANSSLFSACKNSSTSSESFSFSDCQYSFSEAMCVIGLFPE